MSYADLGAMVKRKYPGSYDDFDDESLGKKVDAKYPGAYTDIVSKSNRSPEEQARRSQRAAELRAKAKADMENAPNQTVEMLKDFGAGLGRDVAAVTLGSGGGLLENVGQLAGLVTPGVTPDNAVTRAGRQVKEFYEPLKSEELRRAEQAQQQEVAKADGVVGKGLAAVRGMAKNPMAAAPFLADQLPLLLPGAGAGRLAAAAGGGARAVEAAGVGAGAVMQGASVGGSTYDDLMSPEMDQWWSQVPEIQQAAPGDRQKVRARMALSLSRQAGAEGGAASLLTNLIPGGSTAERVVAGAGRKVAGTIGKTIASTGAKIAGEGLQEGLEEGSGQLLQNASVRNVDSSRDLFQGVGEAATLGALGGISVGGASAVAESGLLGGEEPGRGAPSDKAATAPAPVSTESVKAVDTSALDKPDAVSQRNLETRAREREEGFSAILTADPSLSTAVAQWREQNPGGYHDQFLEDMKGVEEATKTQAALQTPQVQEAQQKAAVADEKLVAAAQVAEADPAQAPPAGITPAEARDIRENGTAKLEAAAKAAQETVRTEIQTVMKNDDTSHSDVVQEKAETIKATSKKEAATSLREVQKAMETGAVAFDEDVLRGHAAAAGMPEEAITARVASAKKKVDDREEKEREKAEKDKARGGQGEQGRQTPAKATSAPAATKRAKAPPSVTAEPAAAASPVGDHAQELLDVFRSQGRAAAQARYTEIIASMEEPEAIDLSNRFLKLAKDAGVETRKTPGAPPPSESTFTPGSANDEQAAPADPGTREEAADQRHSRAEVASEPGGALPEDARGVHEGGSSGRASGDDGTPGAGRVRSDERGAVRVDRVARSDERSDAGVPAGRLEQVLEHSSSPMSPGGNFRAADEGVGPDAAGTVKQFEQNLEALKVLRQCTEERRGATPDEKRVLGKWNGWGPIAKWLYPDGKGFTDADKARFQAIKEFVSDKDLEGLRRSTLNAHYTSPAVVDAMWGAIRSLGFPGGTVVDPSMGSGIFFGRMPLDLMDASKLRGIELENITAGISKLLYEQADITAGGYEEQRIAPNSVDLHISNVPFGNFSLRDSETGERAWIHNFFFQKAVRTTRPGGLIVFITGKGTMDAMSSQAGGPEFRKAIAKDARFLGAVRLPDNAFLGSANTKVVTDIIVLQKRAEGDPEGASWFERGTIAGVGEDGSPRDFEVNEYYSANPDRILGEVRAGSLYRKAEGDADITVASTGRDIAKEIKTLLADLPGLNRAAIQDQTAIRTAAMVDRSVKLLEAEELPPRSVFEKDGTWYKTRGDNAAEPVEIDPKAAEVLRAVLPVRSALRALLAAQLKSEDATTARAALNAAYDEFAKGGRTITKSKRYITIDKANSAMLLALEEKKGGKIVKAEIFSTNTQKQAVRDRDVKTADDALLLSLDERGGIDIAFMEERSGLSESELLAGLPGKIFRDPETKGLVLAETYLSGDVAAKLAVAEAAGESFAANADALRAVLPPQVEAEDVRIRIGASWTGTDYLNQFLSSIGAGSRVAFNQDTGSWRIKRGQDQGFEFLSEGVDSELLLQCALNFKPPTVFTRDIHGNEQVDKKLSAVAKLNFDRFQKAFAEWMIETPERTAFVRDQFNRKLGGYALPRYDGAHLSFPGMSEKWVKRFRKHQRNAVWRFLSWGSILLHHDVGTGKTATMIASMMELKRTGKANKPMIVVPNHIVDQFGNDVLDMYPGAKALVLGTDKLAKGKREKTLAQIATGDWDIVIVPHSSFGMLSMSPAKVKEYGEAEVDMLKTALLMSRSSGDMDGRQRKQLEKRIANLEEKLKAQIEDLKGDPGPFFDELGIDAIAVDEAHEFKNLANITHANRIKGVSIGDASKALDMFMKVRHLSSITGGKNIIFATGTPITRTIVETYTYLRYLAPGVLKRMGCEHLDQFLIQFGAITSEAALPPGGGTLRVEQQMHWQNVEQLSLAWGQISDRVSARDTDIVRPSIKGGSPTMVTVPRHPLIGKIMDEIAASIEALSKGSGRNEKGAPNILSEMMRARKLALDWRLLDPDAADLPGSKVNECIRSALEIYHAETDVKGAQVIWCDLGVPGTKKTSKEDSEFDADEEGESGPFNLYQDIKDKLVAGGVPADEIQFIHDHRSEAKKGELFKKMNSGDVRFIIASSRLMSTGANIQTRLAAMHHLDATWNPSDMEQRNGRGIRQGNIYSDRGGIDVRYYSTEKTLDAFFWQTLERKAKTLEAFFSGNMSAREMEDAGMGAVTAAQAKAAASGDREMFEYTIVLRRLQELEDAKGQIAAEVRRAKSGMRSYEDQVATLEAKIELIPPTDPTIEDVSIAGKKFASSGEIAEVIRERYANNKVDPFNLFSINGSVVQWSSADLRIPSAPWSIPVSAMFSPESMDGTDVNMALRRVSPSYVRARLEESLSGAKNQLANMKKKASQEFTEQEELDRVQARYVELHAKLMGGSSNGSSSIEDGGIEQPDDGTVLVDMSDVNTKGVRRSVIAKSRIPNSGGERRCNVYEGENLSRAQARTDDFDAVVPVGSATINGDQWVLFRNLGESFGIPLNVYLEMAQGGAQFRLSPSGDILASVGEERVYSIKPFQSSLFDSYTPRLERHPSKASVPEDMKALEDLSPERVAKAFDEAAEIRYGASQKRDAAEAKAALVQRLEEAYRDIDGMAALSRELEESAALLSTGSLDPKTAAAVYRKIQRKTEGGGKKVHRAVASIADAAHVVAQAEIAKKILSSGLKKTLPNRWDGRAMNDAVEEGARSLGFEHFNSYANREALEKIAGYLDEQFFQAKGKRLEENTVQEFQEWLRGEVTLNANRFPTLAAVGAGLIGSYAVAPGAAQYIATGMVAWGTMRACKKVWDKLSLFHSPRTQILAAVSRNGRGVTGDRIVEMLDQAQFRAAEIAGTPTLIVKKMRRAAGGSKEVGRLLSDFVEGAEIPDAYRGLGINARAVLEGFRRRMKDAGLSTLESYLPRVYLHEGIERAMEDKEALARLLEDIIPKIKKHHPEWITSRMGDGIDEDVAAEDAAMYLLETMAGNARDEEYGFSKRPSATRYETSHTRERVVKFDLPEVIEGADGPIELVDRDFFSIMNRYIPQMSRTLAERETINPTEINSWIRGLQGEDAANQRVRLLGYIRNDLSGKLTRFMDRKWTERARVMRMVNSVAYLGLSAWYPVRNFLFATPLACGLTNFPSAAVGAAKGAIAMPIIAAESLASQPWVKGGAAHLLKGISSTLTAAGKKVGVSVWNVEMAGAITQQVFDDAVGTKGAIARAIMYPSLLTQNAVDVWGFYAGRSYSDRLVKIARRDSRARQLLSEALGEEASSEVISSQELTEEQRDRIGLYYKGMISGTSRSLNLPNFMGTDVGRTLFQFGSIPMEQTRTLATKVLPDPLRSARYATGATLAGLLLLLKLWMAVKDPDDDREEKQLKWLEESPGWQKALWVLSQSGAPQMFSPGFEYYSGTGRQEMSVSEILPMPTVSRLEGAAEAVAKSGSNLIKAGSAGGYSSLDYGDVAVMPLARELVNNQSSLPRSLGIRLGKSGAEEELSGR